MDRQYYRITEVAAILGIGKSLAYRLVAEGIIPSIHMAGTSALRVPAQALADWIKKQNSKLGDYNV